MDIKDCWITMHKEWKIRQELYHRMVTDHTDDLNKIPVEFSNDVVENAIKYFYDKDSAFSLLEFKFPNGDELAMAELRRLKAQLPIKWSCLKKRPLFTLLTHSDCEGYINWKACKPLAEDLKKILDSIPEDVDLGGHIGNFRKKTQTFIDGCMAAYEAKEKLEFR